MSVAPTREGFAPYSTPSAGKPCQTYYKVFGDLKSGVTPVVCINGGPGVKHNYCLPHSDLFSIYGIPIVFYDPVGCGKSTRLTIKHDVGFWTVQLFLDEFFNLIHHLEITEYNIVGESWGGLLGMEIAIRRPEGLRRLVSSSAPVSFDLYMQATRMLLKTMPEDIQEAVERNEAAGTFDSPEYERANLEFAKRFICRMEPWPEESLAVLQSLEEESSAYITMQGPSEFTITGSLKTWNIIADLHKINVPTLLTNGRYDTVRDMTIAPAFREIPNVKWRTFAHSGHLAFVEEREKYMKTVAEFLTQ
ncbi:uncharacterized protein FIBRA_00480 [Fibroporia radiculosa]|uniref:AB hydrolase-1 domain-containing protein n=1 Tax=Fibroporia radiculosa TaxID=599839 RepID=J4HRP1_9APHY|nr:uncharacterized protein FIBRA_00480 [Fibroporia radiculosa]CCL98482.1 predicted protein [Fibroporia radiculosa]